MLAAQAVALRKVGRADLDAVHRLISNMDVVRCMLVPLSTSREQSEAFLNDAVREWIAGSWSSFTRAICDPGLDELIGLCGICTLSGSEQAELWYLLRPDVWGHGLATEAARQMLEFGFGELNLHRIWATCVPENTASLRVLEKLGMRREGLQKSSLKIHGVWVDCYVYAMLAEEWRGLRR
jgi:RimJ/RimL family protein N-acetyltransferase